MSDLQSVVARIRATKKDIQLYWSARNRGTGSFRKVLKRRIEELRGLYAKQAAIKRERDRKANTEPRKVRVTPRQKEVIEQLKTNENWRIRYTVSYGRLSAYFWGAPVLTTVDLRVFESLRAKGLIEEDRSVEYWRLSSLGANS